ncbi:MAG: adenylate kinase [Acidimicrobiia bacterium]
MTRAPRLLILGKQGAGKGTQAARLADHYRVLHLSTGDLFRAAIRARTPYGQLAQPYIDDGNLVPDDVVVGMVREHFAAHIGPETGYVLDGFPRTATQAEALDGLMGTESLDVVIHLEVSDAIVLDRLAGRRTCTGCGQIYHVNHPPQQGWRCDLCGEPVVQRDDDTEAAIARRLELYRAETVPLLEYYEAQGLLVTVDGVGATDDVFARLVAVVDARHTSAIS